MWNGWAKEENRHTEHRILFVCVCVFDYVSIVYQIREYVLCIEWWFEFDPPHFALSIFCLYMYVYVLYIVLM